MVPEPSPFPPGVMRSVVFHWTAGDYRTTYPSYHYCVALGDDGAPRTLATHDLRANMRDVRSVPGAYAAHVAGRNSYAAGIAVCAMRDASPHDFGAYPLRMDCVEAACATAARLCAYYDIAIDEQHVFTHAEAALEDGYFGTGEGERWDVARLIPSDGPLVPADAYAAGETLRNFVRAAMQRA